MGMKPVTRHILFDLLTSAVATGLFFLVAIYSSSSGGKGMETTFAGAGLLFIVAGFVRGSSPTGYSGLKALLLVSVFVVFFAFVRPIDAKIGCVWVIAYASSLAGIYSRRNYRSGAKWQAACILAAALAAIEVSAVFAAPALAQRLTTRTANVPAPAISLVRMDGKSVDSAQLKGHVTVLYFWATWCPPCWQEFPRLERLYEWYRGDPEVVFMAVANQGDGDTPRRVQAFFEYGGNHIPVAFDPGGAAAARLRLRVYPSLLIIDRNWHVRLIQVGFDGSEHLVQNLSREINSLLAK